MDNPMTKISNIDYLTSHTEVVCESNVEQLISAKEIGVTLKRMRLKRSMGLVDLGLRSGLSASYLSQLETGRVVPTIRNLMRVAMVFNVDLSIFFRESKSSQFQQSKQRDRIRLSFGEKGAPFMASESMAALIPDRRIVPCIAELHPEIGDKVFEAHLYQGQEFVFVIEGDVSVSTHQRSEILQQHDVLWLDSNVKRQYRCAGKVLARVMIISFPYLT